VAGQTRATRDTFIPPHDVQAEALRDQVRQHPDREEVQLPCGESLEYANRDHVPANRPVKAPAMLAR
jgi:hypothetical protein